LPSGVRGTPGVGYFGHCASVVGEKATISARTPAVLSTQFISNLLRVRVADRIKCTASGRVPGVAG
jgi:hypothetical protein